MLKGYIYTLLFVTIFSILNSQNLKFEHYSTDNGLSNSTVWKITQDNLGFIWLGTADGLNKFDAYNFIKFKYNPEDTNTISDNNVYDLLCDVNGNIWIATRYGLNRYNPVLNRFKRFIKSSEDSNSLSDNYVRCIIEDGDLIWIGTDNGGLNTYNKVSGEFNQIVCNSNADNSESETITCLLKDSKNYIWIGTRNNGLYRFDKYTKTISNYKFSHKNGAYTAMKNDITTIFEDSEDVLWIGSRGAGLTIFDREKDVLVDYTGYYDNKDLRLNYWIRSIAEDKYKQIWVATKNGLTSINRKQNKLDFYYRNQDNNLYSISSDNLYDLFIDAAGSLWLANYESGFDIVHHTKVNFRHYKKNEDDINSIRSNIVLAFEEDEYGSMLIGSYDGGLSLFDRRINKMTHYNTYCPELNKAILKIYLDANGIIWLGTWGRGLQAFDRRSITVKEYLFNKDDSTSISNNTVISIYDDKRGHLWIGTYNGLNLFDKKTEKFTRFTEKEGMPAKVIYYITGNQEDEIWIGTKGRGMSIYDMKTGKFKNFVFNKSDSNSISNNVVNSIYDDKQGHLWLATEVGLNRFNKSTEKFIRITEKDGLPNNKLWGILEDERGNLWISSNYGITRYTPDYTDITKGKFRNFNKSDGLQGNDFTQTAFYKKRSGNEMFFGGTNGFNTFFPNKIVENDFKPPVHIINFKKMDKEVVFKGDTTILYKKNILVSWKENFIAFDFAGLDYTSPDKNLYSYKMEGLDINWSKPSTRNYASYPNIRDGEYVFKVKAANNEGIWNEDGISVSVVVNPPFWRTKWFLALVIIFIVLIIFLYIRLRTKRLEEEKRILEETVTLRTLELRQKNDDITSSIQYAKRIQVAILPTVSSFQKEYPDSFILYKPKDIVSGDFFWFYKKGSKRIFAAADCTGHGVPGAFMSIIGNNLLEKIVKDKSILDPAKILTELDLSIKEALDQRGRKGDTFDGMDIALCVNEEGSNIIEYAGAYRPLLHIRGRDIVKIKPIKRSIGGSQKIEKQKFETSTIEVEKGDIIYAFSDGYADQFGGPRGRKFMMKNMQEELANIHHFPMSLQKDYLDETIEIWMNNYISGTSQVDDILVVGVKF